MSFMTRPSIHIQIVRRRKKQPGTLQSEEGSIREVQYSKDGHIKVITSSSLIYLLQLSNGTRRVLVGPMRQRLIDLFKTEMAEADWPTKRTGAGNPADFGGILSTGWCDKKI